MDLSKLVEIEKTPSAILRKVGGLDTLLDMARKNKITTFQVGDDSDIVLVDKNTLRDELDSMVVQNERIDKVKILPMLTPHTTNVPREMMGLVDSIFELKENHLPPVVYFLLQGDELVYVGQSVTVSSRIITHRTEKVKKFDRVLYIPVRKEDLNEVERAFIRYFKPRYNGETRRFNESGSCDVEYCDYLVLKDKFPQVVEHVQVEFRNEDGELTDKDGVVLGVI